MSDTLVSVQPNGTAPSPFRILPRYRWETFQSNDPEEQETYGGFAAKVRVNPSLGELRAEAEALRDEGQASFFKLAAHRVVAWNALAADEDGTEIPIPAPGEPDSERWHAFAGALTGIYGVEPLAVNNEQWQAVYALEEPLVGWLQTTLLLSHLGGEARKNFWATFGQKPAPGNERRSESETSAPKGNESP